MLSDNYITNYAIIINRTTILISNIFFPCIRYFINKLPTRRDIVLSFTNNIPSII